jgi:hypothetical protein
VKTILPEAERHLGRTGEDALRRSDLHAHAPRLLTPVTMPAELRAADHPLELLAERRQLALRPRGLLADAERDLGERSEVRDHELSDLGLPFRGGGRVADRLGHRIEVERGGEARSCPHVVVLQ